MNYRSKLQTALMGISLLITAGCSYLPDLKMPALDSFPFVYKVDIQQGNVITQEMVDQLRPGMTKRQVQYIMGTPLIKDTFNQSRWDYVYSFQPGGEQRQQESFTIYFEGDTLSYFEGDYLPRKAVSN